MTNPVRAGMIAMAGVLLATRAIAAPCGTLEVSIEVDVQEAPIAMVRDVTLADLRAMSARLQRVPAHAVLGFYAGAVGYAVRSLEIGGAGSTEGTACPGFRLEADLVAVDRRIDIAKDLTRSPCRLRGAVEHYRHHANAASLALHRFAVGLPSKLGPEIREHIRSQPGTSQELRLYVDTLLDAAVDSFTNSLAEVHEKVDAGNEIQRLSAPCDET